MKKLELLMDELREALESKMIISFNLFNEISRPRGYSGSFLKGACLNYKHFLEEIGCTLLDMGETETGYMGVCFRFDRTGQEFQAISGLNQDNKVVFDLFALDQWVENDSL